MRMSSSGKWGITGRNGSLRNSNGGRNGFDNVRRPMRQENGKNNKRPESITAKEDTILKNDLGPKYPELK